MDKVLEKSKEYEQITVEYDPIYEMLLDGVEIVKEFIRKNKLIIYGGKSMDFALRLKGDKLYADNDIPDLDFFSPDSVEHAYTLSDILYNKGYKEARAIRATFVHTMRIDLAYNHFVADISYIPKSVFDKLPFLEYDGMRFIHPEFQKIDIHSSLSFPYDDSPREVIFARWSKDTTRYNLLNKYYPTTIEGEILPLKIVKIPAELKQYVFNGFLAYGLIYKYFADAVKDMANAASDIIKSDVSINETEITFKSIDDAVDIMHFDLQKMVEDLKLTDIQHFHPYINLIPELMVAKYKNNIINIHSIENKLLSVNSVKINDDNLRVVNIHYLMKYFLSKAHLSANKIKNCYLAHYISLQKMISVMEQKSLADGVEDLQTLKSNPLFPSIYTYGNKNTSPAYDISINMMDSYLDNKARFKVPINYNSDKNIPKSIPHPIFDYNSSEFFLESGEQILVTGGKHHHKDNKLPHPIRTLDDINDTAEFDNTIETNSLHIGQRKLFLVELKFLIQFLSTKEDKCLVVYAGSAPSIHTPHLHEYFPNVKFILVDPAKFYKPLRKYIKTEIAMEEFIKSDDKFLVINEFFNDQVAELIKKLYSNLGADRIAKLPLYFWSDIRLETDDASILLNSAMQLNWIAIINPVASMLKFREPFHRDEDKESFDTNIEKYSNDMGTAKKYIDFVSDYKNNKFIYFEGDIWIQPWAPKLSTETRLVFKGFPKFKSYPKYRGKLWYYNTILRQQIYHNPLSNKDYGFDHCNDCALEYDILNSYDKKIKSISVKWKVRDLTYAIGRRLDINSHGKLFP